jgi:trk system potassium uptake protein TrkH
MGKVRFVRTTVLSLLPAWMRWTVRTLAVLAVVSLALEFGFERAPLPRLWLTWTQAVAVAAYLVSRAWELVVAPNRRAVLRGMWVDGLIFAGVGSYLLFRYEFTSQPALRATALSVAILQGVLAVRLGIEAIRLNLLLSQSRLHPSRLLALTFFGLVVVGTLALSLPRATAAHVRDVPWREPWEHVLNCAFTAVSATCVTGLVVYDTGTDFTPFGQAVILLLIQFGGLGIMVFGALFGLLAGRELSLRQSLALQDALSHRTVGHMRDMVKFIVVSALVLEVVGAVLLYPLWAGPASPRGGVFVSLFHSVSAFCNAGFALQSDSLMRYEWSWQTYGVVVPLVVLGGLGFPVLLDLARCLQGRARWCWALVRGGLRWPRWGGPRGRWRHRFSLHSRLVLTTTAILVVTGTVVFFFLETGSTLPVPGGSARTMRDAGIVERLLDSFFLSVTCRTAGFNTVDMGTEGLSPGSHFLASLLMFIGGSPASAAGGIKTVCAAVLWLGVISTLRGRTQVESFGRAIPEIVLRRCAVIVMMMGLTVAVGALVLMHTEEVSVREALFEAVSACATVGLSTGLTPELTVTGRIVIMTLMFAGRVGPLTLLAALAGSSRPARFAYPPEPVSLG